MKEIQYFDSIGIRLASPEKIRMWSYGEIKKPETINYRTLRPERDGLFCERIFGTTKEWECTCGKFRSIRYKGVICDRCGVEVTHFRVRRERIGHIELAAPVAHIWYYRATPSRIGLFLNLSATDLRAVLLYEKYIITDAGDTPLLTGSLLTDNEYEEARVEYGQSFSCGMGADAIRLLLEDLDLDKTVTLLREQMDEKGAHSDSRLLKRIEIIENFRQSGNRPEWMILNVVPVIPPDLRPMVQLDGGRFATSDLNDLYRRVINRNNRLKRLQVLDAPEIIVRNEKRMLQEAVDALFDNSKRVRVAKNSSNRPLRSLSDMLRGKQGRFRQNLLGKRVDYSGRSVIVVGPELQLHECGFPTKMALELYKPFIMKRLVEEDVIHNIKRAKTLVEEEAPEVFVILEQIVKEHPILLNRAPTLHRLGIQSFTPKLVDGKAIRLHPLVCHAFNADFDGDQMAAHVPLTHAAQTECWSLMLSSRNLLNPANGEPVVFPSQDMVLGINYLTKDKLGAMGEGKYFSSVWEALYALDFNIIEYGSRIHIRMDGKWIETTAGRIIFNEEIPDVISYVNETIDEKGLRRIIAGCHSQHGSAITVNMLDSIKKLGFKYATVFGATVGMDDVIVPESKKTLIESANKDVVHINQQYRNGIITQEERYNRVVDVWSNANEQLTNEMMRSLENDKQGFNQLYMMINSGARGSRGQVSQLGGMRGLMAKPSGDIIELPIRANFKEGLSVIEFFISTNGARKGLADTALKTSDAGYLTRRLVDISQDVVINVEDCGTINGITVRALREEEEVVEPLADRIRGRFTLEQVFHPISGEMIIDVNEEISDEVAAHIEEIGIESVFIRSVLTCEAERGVCQRCYGRNLATNRTVVIGEAVGIIAAQSIGQPGTQLTMRTFHIGGAATKIAEENQISMKYPVYVHSIQGNIAETEDGVKLLTRRGQIELSRIFSEQVLQKGDKQMVEDGQKIIKGEPLYIRDGETIYSEHNAYCIQRDETLYLIAQQQTLPVRTGGEIFVRNGQIVEANSVLARFDVFSEPIICEYEGLVRHHDIFSGTTLNEVINEDTGLKEKTISEHSVENMQPRLILEDENGKAVATYQLPNGAFLSVEDGEYVKSGKILAKLLKASVKTRDITGGLPRVVELFEARQPGYAAVLAKIDGKVVIKELVKSNRIIIVEDEFGKEFKHEVPMGRHLLVRDGDVVKAGEMLCDGQIDPHAVLSILGENALQSFLVNEIQEVYRLQGVNINDKHIGIIIRQMIRKVELVYTGDTKFIIGQQINKHAFRQENERVLREGGQPAIARPLLQGITRASLNIDSFISAASFQETTRVLTNAAIAGSRDALQGLKENVIIGHLIPAGTGMRNYRDIKLHSPLIKDLDVHVTSIIDKRKAEVIRQVEEEQEALKARAKLETVSNE